MVLYRSYGVVMRCYHGGSGALKDHDEVPFLEVRLLYTLVACIAWRLHVCMPAVYIRGV